MTFNETFKQMNENQFTRESIHKLDTTIYKFEFKFKLLFFCSMRKK